MRGFTMEFKELFRECRIKHFLTQRNMAQKLNVPVSTLKSWEQGTAIPIEKLEELYLQRKLKKK